MAERQMVLYYNLIVFQLEKSRKPPKSLFFNHSNNYFSAIKGQKMLIKSNKVLKVIILLHRILNLGIFQTRRIKILIIKNDFFFIFNEI